MDKAKSYSNNKLITASEFFHSTLLEKCISAYIYTIINQVKRINLMTDYDNTSNNDQECYRYTLPSTLPIFEEQDREYYRWVLTTIFKPRYQPGMDRQEFLNRIQQGYDSAVERDDELLIEKWPKANEIEYLVDWFAVYVRYIMQKPKHFKVFN